MHPIRLVIAQKYREWQDWQVCKSEPLSHTTHGKNKSGSFIKIINGKAKIRRVQRDITKRVWDFGMVWEAEIYPQTAGKDGCPAIKRLAGDTIDISEWLEFEFYELVWFWND